VLALVVSNLLYPVIAIGVAALLCLLIVLRHRRPKSVEANMAAFHKGLRALSPEGNAAVKASNGPAQRRVEQRRPPATAGPRAKIQQPSDRTHPVDEVEAETG
jgi:hypothetical protein